MHMTDALVSTAVGSTMWCGAGATLGYSIKKIRLDFDEKKIPVMGVMGAFIFASQMINFAIPPIGASGHISGAMLLAVILGPAPAFLTMSVVLLIQAMFFADGGILAYGCNVINMGFYASFIAYPLIFKPIMGKCITKTKITIASVLATIVSIQLGAFSVVLETYLSGVAELPFQNFLYAMQPVHLVIGVVEGIITAGVLNYIYRIRSDIMEHTLSFTSVNGIRKANSVRSYAKILITFTVLSLIIGGILSQFASSNPDGLKWSIIKIAGSNEITADSQVHKNLEELQKNTAVLPDYSLTKGDNEKLGTSVSGIIGGAVVCLFSVLLGVFIKLKRKRAGSDGR